MVLNWLIAISNIQFNVEAGQQNLAISVGSDMHVKQILISKFIQCQKVFRNLGINSQDKLAVARYFIMKLFQGS